MSVPARRSGALALLGRLGARVQPGAGGVVMATAVVSAVFHRGGHETVSLVLLVIGVAIWAALAALLATRLARQAARVALDARSPAALTATAGTAALGARLALLGWTWAAVAALALAAIAWLAVAPAVARGWGTPTVGLSFLATVSTQALAILCALVAAEERLAWLVPVALALLVLGLALYVVVLIEFDFDQVLSGLGDHWVAGGALAISATACGILTETVARLGTLTALHGALELADIVIWAAAIGWLIPLALAELLRPRWHYDHRRWATVFPLGMYAEASFVVAKVASEPWLAGDARGWTWLALAAWLLAAAGLGRAARRALDAERRSV